MRRWIAAAALVLTLSVQAEDLVYPELKRSPVPPESVVEPPAPGQDESTDLQDPAALERDLEG